LHNNAPTYPASHPREILQELRSELTRPSTFRFLSIWTYKGALRGHQFVDDDEVKEATHDWLCTQSKEFYFSNSIRKLVDCYTYCSEKQGDYIDK
jgi:hypothetical protein